MKTQQHMNKRGLHWGLLLAIIGIVLALIIVLLFYFRFPWAEGIDKEACHQSIVQRSTFNMGPFEPGKSAIPLKCRTEKICVSKSGEPCSEFPAETKENPISDVKISGSQDSREVILETLSQSLYDCHDMVGRGLLDFMPREFSEKKYCLICSRVAFDQKVQEEVPDIPYAELYRYMQQKKNDEGKSYLRFVYRDWENWEGANKYFETAKAQDPNLKDLRFEDWKIDLDQPGGQAIIVAIIPESEFKSTVGSVGIGAGVAGLVIASGLLIATGMGAPAGIGLLMTGLGSGTAAGGIAYFTSHPTQQSDRPFVYMAPSIYPYDAESLKQLGCNSFETSR